MEEKSSRKNDLYDRCLKFAVDVRALVRQLPKTTANIEDGKQGVRASGSVGANYIEAWDSISDRDELHRLKICRKEAKEGRHWLVLIFIPEENVNLEKERQRLAQEAFELTRIFGSIVSKKEPKKNESKD
jgi:four helix bundle protein